MLLSIQSNIKLIFLILYLILLASCNNCNIKFKCTNQEIQCESFNKVPPANIGENVIFTFLIKEIRTNTLNIDFDNGSGGNYNSLFVQVKQPLEWKGEKFEMYFQGIPVLNGITLKTGDSFEFKEKVPHCISDLWLFL